MNKPDAFLNGKWIWINEGDREDEYADFVADFYCGAEDCKNCILRISADSDYAVFINGQFVNSNQYGDYEHYKIYDDLAVSDYLRAGKNRLAVRGYHCGTPTSRYKPAAAGVIFEIFSGSKLLLSSDKEILSRKSVEYISGRKSFVSVQLGYNFAYNGQTDDTLLSEELKGLVPSKEIEKKCVFFPRPIEKQKLLPRISGKIIHAEGKRHYILDLGAEHVGLPYLEIVSDTTQKIKIAFGEHLINGGVMQENNGRNFSYEYYARQGANNFTEYMLRIGCRYLEVFSEGDIEIEDIGVIPQRYEVKRRAYKLAGDELDKDIYEVCVRTLELCMMEHYVDCPWREQCLYAFDSRNQMLCGYYAFQGGNSEYVKANLMLIAQNKREDGLLDICYPAGLELVIPSFTLYYIFAVEEYINYTKDYAFGAAVYNRLEKIMDGILINRKNGLINRFSKAEYWNFYDWSEYMTGILGGEEPAVADAMINCLGVMALKRLENIARACGKEFRYTGIEDELKERIRQDFYDEREDALELQRGKKEFCELTNSLAVLAGIFDKETKNRICGKLAKGEFSKCSLSMKIFKYEALLTAEEDYRKIILAELRSDYGQMLESGATSVWETVDGAQAFDGCGSLCHGWSAVPVYLYHRLGMAENLN